MQTKERKPLRCACAAVLVLAAGLLAGCGGPGGSAASGGVGGKMTAYQGPDNIMTADAANKTVTFNLIGAEGNEAGGFNFNGFAKGAMALQVPTGWKVHLTLRVDSDTPHSALVVPWGQRQASTFTPAFPDSASPDYKSGIAKGAPPQEFTFTADKAGRYALVCGVPAHDTAGMWDEFDVVDNAAAPQVLVKR